MQCEFCLEDIQDQAQVCPHCRKPTAAARRARSRRIGKWVAIGLGTPVAALVLLAMIGSQLPEQSPLDRIQKSCERQYAPDENAVARCGMSLALAEANARADRKLEQAARQAGVLH